jgi:hypothetical protein
MRSICEAPIRQKLGTTGDDQTCPSTARSSTVAPFATTSNIAWNWACRDLGRSDRQLQGGDDRATTVRASLNLSGHGLQNGQARRATESTHWRMRAILPGDDRSLVAGARRLTLNSRGCWRCRVSQSSNWRRLVASHVSGSAVACDLIRGPWATWLRTM